jgi:hypothetical protein
MLKDTPIPIPTAFAAGVLLGLALCMVLTEAFSRPEAPNKTHYSVCLENTYPKCVLANKTLPSLETFRKVATEIQCKELKL